MARSQIRDEEAASSCEAPNIDDFSNMAGKTGGPWPPHFFWSKISFMNIIMANAFDSLVKAKKEKIFVWGRPKPFEAI